MVKPQGLVELSGSLHLAQSSRATIRPDTINLVPGLGSAGAKVEELMWSCVVYELCRVILEKSYPDLGG